MCWQHGGLLGGKMAAVSLSKKQATGERRALRLRQCHRDGEGWSRGSYLSWPWFPSSSQWAPPAVLLFVGGGAGAGEAGFPRAFSHFHVGVIRPDVKHVCRDKCASNHTFLPPE